MHYSYNTQYPISFEQLPERIRLSNGLTRTDKSTFTEDELIDAGYILVEDPPNTVGDQYLEWTGTEWIIKNYTNEEIQGRINALWDDVRNTRNNLIESTVWRIQRYESQIRMGRDPDDDIRQLDNYVQSLRDITTQADPSAIVWPTPPWLSTNAAD